MRWPRQCKSLHQLLNHMHSRATVLRVEAPFDLVQFHMCLWYRRLVGTNSAKCSWLFRCWSGWLWTWPVPNQQESTTPASTTTSMSVPSWITAGWSIIIRRVCCRRALVLRRVSNWKVSQKVFSWMGSFLTQWNSKVLADFPGLNRHCFETLFRFCCLLILELLLFISYSTEEMMMYTGCPYTLNVLFFCCLVAGINYFLFQLMRLLNIFRLFVKPCNIHRFFAKNVVSLLVNNSNP